MTFTNHSNGNDSQGHIRGYGNLYWANWVIIFILCAGMWAIWDAYDHLTTKIDSMTSGTQPADVYREVQGLKQYMVENKAMMEELIAHKKHGTDPILDVE